MAKEGGHVISYDNGYAWGISPEGKTVCLGAEEMVKKNLADSKMKPNNPVFAQIYALERQLEKKQAIKEREVAVKVAREKKELHKRAVKLGVARETKKQVKRKTRRGK